jgi:hypothetical protein
MLTELELYDARDNLRTVANQVLDFYKARTRNLQSQYEVNCRAMFVQYDVAREKELQQFFTEQEFDNSKYLML